MSRFFYPKLAFTNLKKNRQTYVPFILTAIISIIMFYNLQALAFHTKTMQSQALSVLLNIGVVIAVIFLSIFLFYTNSFLVKRRKKEFGLFNILGMEKKHIGKIMLWETFYVSFFSIFSGLVLGIVFSKLAFLLLYKILHFNVSYSFELNWVAVGITTILFLIIFFAILLTNLGHVHLAKPIELLKGGNTGEKEPKTKWIIAAIGFLTLGTGYFLALSLNNPIAAFPTFLLAVVLVIIGTYCLFTAGSIAILKMLRKNKNYYYKSTHFTSISGMIYRMKQNAVGLANICILSTAVLVTISTTLSLYAGMDDVVNLRQATDIAITQRFDSPDSFDSKPLNRQVKKLVANSKLTAKDYNAYHTASFISILNGNQFTIKHNTYMYEEGAQSVTIMPSADYSNLTDTSVTLNPNEVLVCSSNDSLKFEDTIQINDATYHVKTQIEQAPLPKDFTGLISDTIFIVVSDMDQMQTLLQKQFESIGVSSLINFNIAFNLEGTPEEKLQFAEDFRAQMPDLSPRDISSKQEFKESCYELYGGFLFLGIFLGGLFLMATVLIIYYKQVVEGFEDKERFIIMQKVGMSKGEVKKSIHSQVLTVFALPILVAIIHIIVAFPIMQKLLLLLNLDNAVLFAICTAITALVFILIYIIVYLLTAKVYYRIIDRKE